MQPNDKILFLQLWRIYNSQPLFILLIKLHEYTKQFGEYSCLQWASHLFYVSTVASTEPRPHTENFCHIRSSHCVDCSRSREVKSIQPCGATLSRCLCIVHTLKKILYQSTIHPLKKEIVFNNFFITIPLQINCVRSVHFHLAI